MNLLRVDARPAKLVRNTEQYRAVESMEGLVPWNGNHDNMIDRFDGRALLDFYKDPLPRRQKKTEDELQLEEVSSTHTSLKPERAVSVKPYRQL